MDKKYDLKILGILFVFVFILEFWISINSYTHDLYNRIDSAIFFMCGKAWMNGMTPYVDFADSKGPLLWLIFGVGYLFSNHNYIGIFWIECIFYSFTFFYCFKIAGLFLSDKKQAILCSMLMALSFFCVAYHYETRAEDFCQLFICSGLYYTLRVLYGLPEEKDLKKASFVLGIGFAATFLIKFTLAAMMAILFFALFYYLVKRRKDLLLKSLFYAIFGISLIFVPFLLYFLWQGNLYAFIHEYFVATTQTIVTDPTFGSMIKDYILTGWGSIFRLHIFRSAMLCFLLLNIALGCVYYYRKLSDYKWFPAIMAFWFVSISMYHALGYYYQSFAVFAIFPIMMYLTLLQRFLQKKRYLYYAAGIITIIGIAGNLVFTRPNFFLNDNKERTDFYYINRIMSQVNNPKIMYSFYDTGYGTPVHALPACKYWIEQLGATAEMKAERTLAVKQQLPDFVFVLSGFYDSEPVIHLLEQSGYVKYHTWMTQEANNFIETHLYGKPGIVLPTKDFQVSPTDILRKRRIISAKNN